ncbi:MAG: hypothetical protein K9K38_07255 [Rhodoferax sp.]|nr:hypothetical protein [Rhodoferax sp.]
MQHMPTQRITQRGTRWGGMLAPTRVRLSVSLQLGLLALAACRFDLAQRDEMPVFGLVPFLA